MTAERAPEAPARGWSGWSWGPGITGHGGGPRTHPAGPVLALQATPWFWALIAASGPIWRDSTSFLVKLVKTVKCHQNMSIRPPLVPISKTDFKSHLLKFSGFHFAQPSLTRN